MTHHLHDPRIKAAPGPQALALDVTWSPAVAPAFDAPVAGDGAQPWLWVHTSGTTGLPKFLSLGQRMVIQRSQAVAYEFRPRSRHVLLAHCYSRPFLARAAVLLSSFDVVDDTCGASETSKSYSTLWQRDATGRPVAAGKMRDSEVQVVNLDGTPVAFGERGIVRVRNPYMVAGYLNDPDATAESFRDGWLYPGDVDRLEAFGRLRVADRADHVMNIMGNKLNAFVVDQLLRTPPGVLDAISFRNPRLDAPDELFAFVVPGERANRLQAVASPRHAFSERIGEYAVTRVIQPVSGIPSRADGADACYHRYLWRHQH